MTDKNRPPQAKIHEAAEAWVNGEGYPVEFAAEAAFRAAGLATHQGQYALDDVSGKALEIDLVAIHDHLRTDPPEQATVAAIVECKFVPPDKGWLFFRGARAPLDPAIVLKNVCASELGAGCLWLASENQTVTTLPLFKEAESPGFGGCEFTLGEDKKRQTDPVYEALNGVAARAHHHARFIDRRRLERGIDDPLDATACWPIVVVDGPLLSATYDAATGRLRVAPVGLVRVAWNGSAMINRLIRIDVVTKAYLTDYAAHMFAPAARALAAAMGELTLPLREAVLAHAIHPDLARVVKSPHGPPLFRRIQKAFGDAANRRAQSR